MASFATTTVLSEDRTRTGTGRYCSAVRAAVSAVGSAICIDMESLPCIELGDSGGSRMAKYPASVLSMSAIARGGVAAQAAAEGKAGVVWASVRVLQASASVGKAEHMERLGHGKHERVEREAAMEAAEAAVKGKGRARRREEGPRVQRAQKAVTDGA
jgi:hypothetical protein